MPQKIKLGLIYGSARQGRFCDTVANWIASEIRGREQFTLDLIDPRDLATGRAELATGRAELTRRLGDADAFVVVAPEYNHGYTADLKSLTDAYSSQWQAKPLAFVSYGGISGGLRAVEQLRLVFAELHAVAIRDTVSFAYAWSKFDEKGELIEPREARDGRLAVAAAMVGY